MTCLHSAVTVVLTGILSIRGVRNPMKMSDIGFLKLNRTELTSKFKNRKLSFRSSVFKNPTMVFGDVFSRCLIHNSSYNMIQSTVKVFFFMPYHCTSSSESLRLTIKIWKALSTLNNTQCKKPNRKTETADNFVKLKPNRKPFFAKPNQSHFLPTVQCTPLLSI